ncbi:MAG: ribosome biogenesis GTPase Der [Bacillota bacterium]
MSLPIVALIGRPNVGKSTLFNRIVGGRVSIVENIPGVTRDRIYQRAEWLGTVFNLIDTGGIIDNTIEGTLEEKIRSQAELAIDEADLIIFVVDAKTGMVPGDLEIANVLRKSSKAVILAVNKIENFSASEILIGDFYALGLGDPLPVSAAHGMNIGDLLDEVITKLPSSVEAAEDEGTRIAVLGRPNVGKSSLVNYILGEERSIVSQIPGTTRDSINTSFEFKDRKYILIDTAGIRRKSRIYQSTERYSVVRSLKAIDDCQVALFLIDAEEGVTEQDKRIIGLIHEAGKATIIVINKWDLIKKDTNTMRLFEKKVREELVFISYAPTIYISALTGQRVDKLLEMVDFVDNEATKRFPVKFLNQYLNEITTLNPPPSGKGKKIKFSYLTQTGSRPPTFVFFVNHPEEIHFSYQRYLENKLREAFSFTGSPVRMIFKEKG